MRRREFITLLGGVTAGRPLIVRARQVDRVRLIGVLMGYAESDREGQDNFAAFREVLQKRVDGGQLPIVSRVCLWFTPRGSAVRARHRPPIKSNGLWQRQRAFAAGRALRPPPATMSYHHIICDDCSSPRLNLPRWAASRKEGASCIGL